MADTNEQIDQCKRVGWDAWLNNNKVVLSFVGFIVGSTITLAAGDKFWYEYKKRRQSEAHALATISHEKTITDEYALHAYKKLDCWTNSKGYNRDKESCEGEALLETDKTQNKQLATQQELIIELVSAARFQCELLLKAEVVETCTHLP